MGMTKLENRERERERKKSEFLEAEGTSGGTHFYAWKVKC